MPTQSIHDKLKRVRPPRVHITYNVETGDAKEVKEVPFVMGILADLSGQSETPLARLKDRPFVNLNPDNFDDVLKAAKPHLAFSVENKLSEDPNAGQLKVDLRFKTLQEFDPEHVARQVKPLRELLELRTRLADLRGTLQSNEKLDELLQEIITSTEKLEKLRGELGLGESPEGGAQ